VNLVEFPAVSPKSSRLRLQVMADHTPQDIEEFIETLRAAAQDARREYDSFVEPADDAEADPRDALQDSMVVPKLPEGLDDSAIVPKYPRVPSDKVGGV